MLLGFLGTQLLNVLERRWDHPNHLSYSRRKTVKWWSYGNPGQQSLGPVTRALWLTLHALLLLPRCHTIAVSWALLGTVVAPPVLESTIASTVGEIFQLENYHLAFLTNTEHLKRIHIATVQEPQTIPRAVCLGSFPSLRQRLPNSILSYTRIKPERPMSLAIILNLYQYIWEQIWGPSLKHHRLAMLDYLNNASQEQKIYWQ